MKRFTLQEYYDAMVVRALDGGFPSYSASSYMCVYRFGDKACAVGILIPDEKYSKELEGKSIKIFMWERADQGVFVWNACKDTTPTELTREDLMDIQECHDKYTDDEVWESETVEYFIDNLNNFKCFDNIIKIKGVLRNEDEKESEEVV